VRLVARRQKGQSSSKEQPEGFNLLLYLVFSTGTAELLIAVTQRPMVTMARNANKQANKYHSDAVLEVTKRMYKTLKNVINYH